MFVKRTEDNDTSSDPSRIEQYLNFTASPTRNRKKRREDYEQLSQQSGLVSFVTAADQNILIAETEVITIIDPMTKIEHEIGAFLIYITRVRQGRAWSVNFRFENTTRIIEDCMHPHIKVSEYSLIPRKTGWLCIKDGQHGIYQAIREARIPDAIRQLIDILYMYQDNRHGFPFKKVANWPILGRKI